MNEAEPTKLAAAALNDGSLKVVQLPNYQKVLLGKMSAKDFLDTLAASAAELRATSDRSGHWWPEFCRRGGYW